MYDPLKRDNGVMEIMTQLVKLNERWRIDDDPLQWVLKRRKGKGWIGSAYCTTRTALLSNIRERAGNVDPAAVAFIETWQEQHVHGAVQPMAEARKAA